MISEMPHSSLLFIFFFSSRRRHTRLQGDWSSDVCSSDLVGETLSSGTGASGAAVAAFLRGGTSPITVRLDGGALTVEVDDDLGVRLTGTAEPVFSGELSPQLVDALAAGGP